MPEDIDVRIPLPGTPLDDLTWMAYWEDLRERTGGDVDKVNEVYGMATVSQDTADGAVSAAGVAQAAADAAQASADAAQTSADANTAAIRTLRFLGGLL